MRETMSVDGLTLRRYSPDDSRFLYDAVIESIKQLAAWFPWCHDGYAESDAAAWISFQRKEWADGDQCSFAIVDSGDGGYLGGCGLSRIDTANRMANLGYWVRTSETGRGIATAVTRMLSRAAFDDMLLNRIEILAAVGNLPSRRVAEKAGASLEGILRRRIVVGPTVHDAALYCLLPGDPDGGGCR